jgi:ankyrin repeat protein
MVMDLVMLTYKHDECKELYDKIAEIIGQNPQINLEKLSEELSVKIDLKQKYNNGFVLGGLLLELAIGNNNLTFVSFLFKNELKIINVIAQEGGAYQYYIIKTKHGQAILNHAISCGNPILNLLLENINTEQSTLKPESELYQLYQRLKDNALFTAVEKDKIEAVESLIEFGADYKAKDGKNHTALGIAMEKKQEEITKVILEFAEQKVHNLEENEAGPSSSNGSTGSKPVATVSPMSVSDANPNAEPEVAQAAEQKNDATRPATLEPSNHTEVSTKNEEFVESHKPVKNEFIDTQFSTPNAEVQHKEHKKDFRVLVAKDVVGIIVTGLLITADVMVNSIAGAIVLGIVAACIAIGTGWHIKNSTLPSYREMQKNKVEHVNKGNSQSIPA